MTIRVDPHVHSSASYDGHDPVELLLEQAAEIGLDGIVVTDHDVIHGSLRAAELAPEYGLFGIPGVEVSTAHGHLLGVGVEEMPPRREPYADTVDWIRDHGGVAIVPHPFQRTRHGVRKKNIPNVDAIEAFNAWLFTGYKNQRARRFADAYGYPTVAASDAHTIPYVGRAYTELTIPDTSRETVTVADVLAGIRDGSTAVQGRRAPIPMAVKHYALGAARKSGYYAKVGTLRTMSYAKLGTLKSGYLAKNGVRRSTAGLWRLMTNRR